MADVSVVIPCYNGEKFIADTLDSVLAQTDPVKQVLVIDDGSKDNSAAVIGRYAGDVVQLIRQSNAGESRARNVGIERATGKYVAFLDADDLWLPQKIAKQVELIERHADAVGVHTRVFNFEKNLEDRGREETEKTRDNPTVQDLIEYHFVTPSTLMVRREMLMQHNIRFNEAVRHSEDMLFVSELRLVGPLRLLDEPVTAKRVHAGQQSRDPWHSIWSMQSRVEWFRAHATQIGEELARSLDKDFEKAMVDVIDDRYFKRRFEGIEKARTVVRDLFPHNTRPSLRRRILPAWFYRLRDMF